MYTNMYMYLYKRPSVPALDLRVSQPTGKTTRSRSKETWNKSQIKSVS